MAEPLQTLCGNAYLKLQHMQLAGLFRYGAVTTTASALASSLT